MFSDNPNIIQLEEKIFLYKNFISNDEVELINSIVNKQKDLYNHYFEQIEFKVTELIPDLFPVWNKISELLYPEYVIHPMLHMMCFEEGKQMLPHCDSPGEGMTEDLTVPDVWGTCCALSWGVCVYFGEFSGGEVYYPNQNIEISVQPGDLVIHGALKSHEHGVRAVKSGVRYVFSNFSLKSDKNPGSFYNYGTEEHEERQKSIHKWMTPLKINLKSVILPYLEKYS